jgi:hypothetical protein
VAAADREEYALVQPVEFGCGRFDLGPATERVFARVDIVPAGKASQDLGTSVRTL